LSADAQFIKDAVRTAEVGAAQTLPPLYEPLGPADNTLVFEARFECGNLARAIRT
jgi:hypothetical protein